PAQNQRWRSPAAPANALKPEISGIATDKGWNLYVCGNGGMKPRHADLFASDLDEATLIRSIDRLLMFYIRTADRLQRTSTGWITRRAASPICGRWCWRIVLALARSWSRRWPGSSTATSAVADHPQRSAASGAVPLLR
ncbi:hypothetical protein J4730_05590, partial [Klebsiella pneumoniae]|nr:hypothetical protein [Klebsiella pneumoniae]